jgi:hypothetical protein
MESNWRIIVLGSVNFWVWKSNSITCWNTFHESSWSEQRITYCTITSHQSTINYEQVFVAKVEAILRQLYENIDDLRQF